MIDKKTLFSGSQTLTGTSATSTNKLDFGVGVNPFGGTSKNNYNESVNSSNFVNVVINKPLTTASELTVTVQDSDNGTTFTDTSTVLKIATANIVAGYTDRVALPKNLKRYVQLKYSATALAGGVITSFVGQPLV